MLFPVADRSRGPPLIRGARARWCAGVRMPKSPRCTPVLAQHHPFRLLYHPLSTCLRACFHDLGTASVRARVRVRARLHARAHATTSTHADTRIHTHARAHVRSTMGSVGVLCSAVWRGSAFVDGVCASSPRNNANTFGNRFQLGPSELQYNANV
eukprot:1050957-Alexandrium_andersonii.AAC.1